MRSIALGFAPILLAGLAAPALAQDPPEPPMPTLVPPPPPEPALAAAPTPPPVAVAEVPPTPPSPYRRCTSVGRGQVTTAPCDLRVVDGRPPRLWLRIERNLPSPPAAVILIWRQREDLGGDVYRISGRALPSPGTAAGTMFSVPVSPRYCAPTARRFDVELELADGRNIGRVGQFSFPCGS